MLIFADKQDFFSNILNSYFLNLVMIRLMNAHALTAGIMATYHARNEYCLFSDMCQGFRVFVGIISQLEEDSN